MGRSGCCSTEIFLNINTFTLMKNIIITLLLGFSAMLQAQNSVSGKVTDKDMN
jgi:hypothetical protein